MAELGGPKGQTDFRTNTCDGDNSSAVKGGFGCLSLSLLPRCPTHSYLRLQHVFSWSNWGKGWGQENQKPATQICHRLRSKAQLSERGRHPEEPQRVHHKRAAPGPFSLPRLARLPARPRAPSSQSPPGQPWLCQGLRSPASRPSAVPPQPPSPHGESNPRGAGKGRSGRRWGRRPAGRGAPVPCPLRRPNR